MSESFSVAELDGQQAELLPARTVLSVMFSTGCGCNDNGCDGNSGFGFGQETCAGNHHNDGGFGGFGGNGCGGRGGFGFGQQTCAGNHHNGGGFGGGTPWLWSQVKNFCSQWWPVR